MGTSLITLIEARRVLHYFYPAVLTPDEDVAKMFENGEIVYGGIPPSHNTIKTSPRYGHTIEFREHEENRTQTISVSDIRDDAWIAAQSPDREQI